MRESELFGENLVKVGIYVVELLHLYNLATVSLIVFCLYSAVTIIIRKSVKTTLRHLCILPGN